MAHAKESCAKPFTTEDIPNMKLASRNIRIVLKNPRVPRHQRRGGEAKDLPEGKLPRHERQHRPEWFESYVAAGRVGLARLIRQKSLGVLGVVVTDRRAFLYLRLTLDDRFSHLEGHGPRILFSRGPQDSGGFPHLFCAIRKRPAPPFVESRVCSFQDSIDFARRHFLETLQHLTRGWIDRLYVHRTLLIKGKPRLRVSL